MRKRNSWKKGKKYHNFNNPEFNKIYEIFLDNITLQFTNNVLRKEENLNEMETYDTYMTTQITLNICKSPDCLALIRPPQLCLYCNLRYCVKHIDRDKHDCQTHGARRNAYIMGTEGSYYKDLAEAIREENLTPPPDESGNQPATGATICEQKDRSTQYKDSIETLPPELVNQFLNQMESFTQASLNSMLENVVLSIIPHTKLEDEDELNMMGVYQHRLMDMLLSLETQLDTKLRVIRQGVPDNRSPRVSIATGYDAYLLRISWSSIIRSKELRNKLETKSTSTETETDFDASPNKGKSLLKGVTRKKSSVKSNKVEQEVSTEDLVQPSCSFWQSPSNADDSSKNPLPEDKQMPGSSSRQD